MWGEFQVVSMEGGELCHDRCMVLLLEERMQDIGTAKPNAKTQCAGSVLKCGFGDLSDEKVLNSRKLGRFHDGKIGAKYRGDKNV